MLSKYAAGVSFAATIACAIVAIKLDGRTALALMSLAAINAFMFVVTLCNFMAVLLSGKSDGQQPMEPKQITLIVAACERLNAWITKHQTWLLTLAATLVLTLLTANVPAAAHLSPIVGIIGLAVTAYKAWAQHG